MYIPSRQQRRQPLSTRTFVVIDKRIPIDIAGYRQSMITDSRQIFLRLNGIDQRKRIKQRTCLNNLPRRLGNVIVNNDDLQSYACGQLQPPNSVKQQKKALRSTIRRNTDRDTRHSGDISHVSLGTKTNHFFYP
jgi:hypothetical protein